MDLKGTTQPFFISFLFGEEKQWKQELAELKNLPEPDRQHIIRAAREFSARFRQTPGYDGIAATWDWLARQLESN